MKSLDIEMRTENHPLQSGICAFLETPILSAVGIIGVTTFCISVAGVAVGCWFGARYKQRAEITGGVILVLLGCKILLEHLGLLSF